MYRPRILALILACAAVVCVVCLRQAETQSPLRRITNTTAEGININPSISGDGRILGFESTEDIAGAGGPDHFRAIRANISVDPPTFFQMGTTRAAAPGISQDGSRIAFASKDDPLGTNPDGNSEIFLFNGSSLLQVTNTSPGDLANRAVNGNFQPSISDDGRYIAFSSNRNLATQNADGNLEIFVFDSVASTFAQLTNSTGTVGFTDAKISGNGAKVAYIRDNGSTPSARRDLMLQDRVPGAGTVIANQIQALLMTYGRAISDDGTRVAYSAETATNTRQVFFYDGRTGNVNRQVTNLLARATEVPLHPTMSGDGKRIAFAARRTVTGFSNSDASVEVYTYDIPTTTFARITSATGEADCFDGSSLACEVVSSLNDDGSIVTFNFPRSLSGGVAPGLENKTEIYATGTSVRPPFGTLTSILNYASLGHEPNPVKAVAPNSIAVAQGSALANTTQQPSKQPNGEFPTNVGGTTVTVNGRSAQIFFVSPTQVQFLVPSQTELGTAEVVVTNADGFSSRGTVPIFRTAAGIFTKNGLGTGDGMILNSDTDQEGPFDPGGGNLRLLIFATGARNATNTTVNIGGRVVNAESVVPSPNMPGLDEVRVIVPTDLRGAGRVTLSIQSDLLDSNPVTVEFIGDKTRNILINEVLADPPDGIAGDANHDGVRDGTDDEFIEFVNATTNETIGIGGWKIKTKTGTGSETTRFTFALGTSLLPGNAIVVFGGGSFNPSDAVFGCAQVVRATSSSGLSLTNSGLTINLYDANDTQIATFEYGGSTGREGDNNQSLTRSPDITGTVVQHTTAAGANGRRYSPGLKVDGTPFGNCPGVLTTVTISPPSATINVGQTQQFTAQAFDQFGRAMTGVTINFTSDNTNVATVDSVSMNSTTGVATANVGSHNPGTAHITASATDGATTVNSSAATLTVNGPSLSINDVSQNEGDAGTTTFTFTVSLSQPAPAAVTFNIATQDNTATVANNDYVARSLTSQTIPAGQQTYTFDVTVNGDTNNEQTETFFVNVTNVSGASVTDSQGLGTIVTDDIPVLSINDVSQAEGNSGTTIFTFTVTSNRIAPVGGITFDIATADGTAQDDNPVSEDNDYVANSATGKTIPAGLTSTTFDVTVNGDTLLETNETFFVNITNISPNASSSDTQGLGTIQNDDAANLVISQIYPGGSLTSATFQNDYVELYNRGTSAVDFSVTPYSVQFLSTSGSTWVKTDLTSGTIQPGRYFLIREASGGATGAALPTADATGTINLTSTTAGKVALVSGSSLLTGSCPGDDGSTPFNPVNAAISDFVGYLGNSSTTNHCYEGPGPAPFTSGNNSIADFRKAGGCVDTNDNAADFFVASPNPRNSSSPAGNCQPEITIDDVTVTETNSGTVNATFTVTLSAASAQTVTVNFATADGTATLAGNDYQSNSGMLTFVPGDTSESITVLVNGDTLDEANETFFVNLSGATNAVVLDSQGQGTINDNDAAPSLSIDDVSHDEGNTGTTAFTFTVSLSTASGQTVTVNFASVDNTALSSSDYQSNSGMLTFVPGDTSESITVLVNGDGTFEPNETFFVNLSGATNASISDAQGQGTITNDDAAPPTPTFFITNANVTEGNSGTVNAVFDVSLSPASAVVVQVDYTTVNGSATVAGNDYQQTSGTLTFNPGDGPKQITVLVNGDTLVEPDETFTVHLSNATGGAGIGTPDGVGTILNDDAAQLVISQVYGGGGNSGATLKNDFIEIFNRGTTTVDFSVTPYSVQSASVGSNFGGATASSKTNLTIGTISPGRYFLIQEAAGSGGTVDLPTPDATGSIGLSASAGKVALVVGTNALSAATCPGDDGSSPFNPNDATVADFVGYGDTAGTAGHCYEGSGPATAPSNTTADFRKFGGCQDTNDNAADFVTATPNSRNTSSPINDCTSADLEITKTDSPDPVIVGSNVTYTITVTNHGPATANSVLVTDHLPANVTFVSCLSTGAGVCGGTGNNRTVTFATLAAGAAEMITLVATANGPAGTQISNTATVSSSTTDPISGNNSATTTTDVNNPNFADLAITKSDSIDPVAPGNTLTYTISVTNNGPDTAQSVVVTDSLPADVTFVDCSANQGGVCGGTVTSPTVTFSSLANGVTATIIIRVTVSNALTTGAVLSNTASVAASSIDSNSGNDSDSETTNVQEVTAGEVLISEFRFRGSAGANDEFIELYNPTSRTIDISGFKIFRSNSSAVTTQHATINSGVLLPSGCHYLLTNANASGPYNDGVPGDQTYSTGTADDGGLAVTLASGTASSGILDQVGLSAGSAYKEGTPLASLGSTNDDRTYERKPGGSFGNGTDTNDNSADFLLNASGVSNPQNLSTGCINTSATDLSLAKTDSPDPVGAGANITYTITVTNNGPATATNLTLSDMVPTNTTFVSLTPAGGWICTTPSAGGTGAISCTIASLGLQMGTFTLVVNVNAGVAGSTVISNTASISSSTTDTNAANDSDTETTTVAPSADLSITKTDSADPIASGAELTYTIVVTNNSADPATSVTVTDNLPSDVTFVSCASSGVGVCGGTGNNRTITFTSIAGSSGETITLVVRPNHTSAGTTISNTATVSSSGTSDPNGANNSATQTTAITLPRLVISYIYGGGGATTGSPSYTRDFVEIFNRGTVAINLLGLSLQQGASAGNITSTYSLCPGGAATCTLNPGRYYLIETGTTGTAGTPLSSVVMPDDAGGTPSFAATNGKGALVTGTSALGCGGGTACSAAALARIVDIVGYGTGTTQAEGNSPTGNLSTTTAARRKLAGCQDTNVNSADFDILTPTGGNAPRNTSTTANICPP